MKIDKLLIGSLICLISGYVLSFFLQHEHGWVAHYATGVRALIDQIWWGVLLSIFITGLLAHVPREMMIAVLGTNDGWRGILRATFAGLLLDVCNHGILIIGMRLYERGASIGQTMAFLIASPWNSISLTFILISMIGLKWTLLFVLFSAIVGVLTGCIFDHMVKRGVLPANPNRIELNADYSVIQDARARWRKFRMTPSFFPQTLWIGLKDSRSIMRWVLLGMVITGALRASVTPEQMQIYLGPSFLGIGITLFFATILEVCSEGSTPIAADILNVAKAPGNAFTFLMAGVTSDYTEVMAVRETTKSWKIALFMPLITVPQILFLAWLMNH